MKTTSLSAVISVLVLAACGGGGGGRPTNPGSGPAYAFVTPALKSATRYSETVVDNANNTIDLGFTRTVTTVNPDGSYDVLSADPNHNTVIVNGTDYSIVTGTETLNNSGEVTAFVYTAANGNVVNCIYSPHGGGPVFPIRVGETWTLDYTYACGTEAPIAYTQQGSVVDIESVTVPAGTFTALKLESTVTWTSPAGTTRTETVTNWRDVVTLMSVKEDASIAYSGAVPTTGYAVSRNLLLENTS